MSTLAESRGEIKKPWLWIAVGAGILMIWGAMAFPARHSETLSLRAPAVGSLEKRREPAVEFYARATQPASMAVAEQTDALGAQAVAPSAAPVAAMERKIIRTSSMGLVVQHPAEVTDEITTLAEGLGGYLESSEGGGQNATTGTLTIRVPASRFEEVRAAIRKLGLRVESEKIEAQDVTRQYVDQDASIRNLRAEEAQYLAILKHAGTVKDMLAVTQNLSDVRGQIEQQQAEFNALSRQVETVALTVSLRTEPEAQTFGLNWRPGYQLKLAMRDGLESVADYATAMVAILFYLPATLLWVGTIVVATVMGWRTIRWVGRRWFGWSVVAAQASQSL
jgi:hypothetical protein